MIGDKRGTHPIWRQVRLAWEIVSDRLSGHLSLDAVDLIINHGKHYDHTKIQSNLDLEPDRCSVVADSDGDVIDALDHTDIGQRVR